MNFNLSDVMSSIVNNIVIIVCKFWVGFTTGEGLEMQKSILICDRCGKEIDTSEDMGRVRFERFVKDGLCFTRSAWIVKTVDLCGKCAGSLITWMERKRED